MELKDRVKEALLARFKHQNGELNYSEASRALKTSRQTIMNWVTGSAKEIKDKNLRAIERETGYSKDWVSVEQGSRFVDENAIREPQPHYRPPTIDSRKLEKQLRILSKALKSAKEGKIPANDMDLITGILEKVLSETDGDSIR